jgi:hypothetical protein
MVTAENRIVIPGLTRNPSQSATPYDGFRISAADAACPE